jgi:hypothetical protein
MVSIFLCRTLLRFAFGKPETFDYHKTHRPPCPLFANVLCFGQIRKVVAAAGGIGCFANLAYIPETPNAGRYQRTKGRCGQRGFVGR